LRIVAEHTLINSGRYSGSASWRRVRRSLYTAIRRVEWPPGSGSFTIYPESGKKRGDGNGVKPIKNGLMLELRTQGWATEARAKNKAGKKLGEYDAVLETNAGPVVLEWETGNSSSSHRSMNKMTMNLMHGLIAAGVLVIPSRNMYKFLTDRIGNIQELEPYFDLWRSVPCGSGILEVAVIEHDAESFDVPRIPKGTDGRATI
jgi:hypothetical protein